jgi:circadian clock protein KaiC
VRKAISVLKKRTGSHEDTIRELRFDNGRIGVGKVLSEFRGVLTGVPVYTGTEKNLNETRTLNEIRTPDGVE